MITELILLIWVDWYHVDLPIWIWILFCVRWMLQLTWLLQLQELWNQYHATHQERGSNHD